jgi:hypothetical protein
MARDASDLEPLTAEKDWHALAPQAGKRVWSDQYSNVLSVLRW